MGIAVALTEAAKTKLIREAFSYSRPPDGLLPV